MFENRIKALEQTIDAAGDDARCPGCGSRIGAVDSADGGPPFRCIHCGHAVELPDGNAPIKVYVGIADIGEAQ